MKNVRICNSAEEPYPSFVHNTTTYVGIPHHEHSLLLVQADKPCIISIQTDGGESRQCRMDTPSLFLPVCELRAPQQMDSLTDLLSFTFARPGKPSVHHPGRLSAFSVVFLQDMPDRQVIATFDFRILCPLRFEAARTFHLELLSKPDAISPSTISERVEHTSCPECGAIHLELDQLR